MSLSLLLLLLLSANISSGWVLSSNNNKNNNNKAARIGSSALYILPSQGRSSPRSGKERSKRQERVGHYVRTELAKILSTGHIKNSDEYLDDDTRRRISVVSADVSPDMRQARISVSIRADALTKRRAYSWLVGNTKPIRHTLAQQLKHMKNTPNLSFIQVDVAAAVDVMYLIDKISKGYKRDGELDDEIRGPVGGVDFDEEYDDDDEWSEEDDNFL
jgi:ribosome-binding factor A